MNRRTGKIARDGLPARPGPEPKASGAGSPPHGQGAAPTEVWIADDDHAIRFVLGEALRDAGLGVREFGDAASVRAALEEGHPALLLTDVRMPGADGLELVAEWQQRALGPVIVMSAYTDVATTAAAYRCGAVDYLAKPFDLDEVTGTVQRVLADEASATGIAPPDPTAAHGAASGPALLGHSAPMRAVFRLIGRVAASDLNVLVTGETGTGKELVARALHDESARRNQPFVALNTAAIPTELLESELFGHEAGAFTGAVRRVAGRFEQAEGGTLFLDEIGDMPLALQTRLLRVLAGGEFYRVGGRALIRGNVRIIAATHQDLDARVAAGQFRADLKHRLDVVRIELPPLRTRRADIPLLARHFLAEAAQHLRLPPKRFSRGALKALEQAAFPGNVRELENLCRRLAVVAAGAEIQAAELGLAHAPTVAAVDGWAAALRDWAEQALERGETDVHARARAMLDRTLLELALEKHAGHRQHAAHALGVGRNTLTRKLGASRTRSKT